jgi:hypothetical protein
MSIKETLERFDEKFVDKQRGTVDLLKDEMPNGDFLRADYIKQFITEEIKLAREETIKEEIDYWKDVFDNRPKDRDLESDNIAQNFARIEIERLENKLKKYETIRNI